MFKSIPKPRPVELDETEAQLFVAACRMLIAFQMPGTDPKWAAWVERGCREIEEAMEARKS